MVKREAGRKGWWRGPAGRCWLVAALVVGACWLPVPGQEAGGRGKDRIAVLLGPGPEARKVPPEGELLGTWWFELRREDGSWRMELTSDVLPFQLYLCHPEEPRIRRTALFYVAEQCSGEKGNSLQEEFDRVVRKVEEELREPVEALPAGAGKEAVRELEERATRMLREELSRSGWVERVRASWERNVVPCSPCCREVLGQVERIAVQEGRKQGWSCGDWLQYMRFCTSDGERVEDHLMYEKGLRPPEEVEKPLRLLGEAGLPFCLARIVREDDPELAAKILRLRPDIPDVSIKGEINRRARELWRRRGVDRWYEIVKREGKVPEKLRLKILQCAGGYLPPVVEGGEGKGSPASAR